MFDKNYVWCILHTAGITAEKIKARSTMKVNDADIESMLKAYKSVDGAKVLLSLEPFIAEDRRYPLVGWNREEDEKLKMFHYYLEQDSFMGCYQDDFEQFEKDWNSKEYECDGCITFDNEDIEIIEFLKPESRKRNEQNKN